MFFFRKKKPGLLLSTGRGLGKWVTKEGETVFAVRSAGTITLLSLKQYQAWKLVKTSTNLEEWKSQLFRENLIENEQDFKQVLDFYSGKRLLVEVVTGKEKELDQVKISRNGTGLGLNEDGGWYVGTQGIENKMIKLSKEMYLLWGTADGLSSVAEVLKEVQKGRACSLEEALTFFGQHGREFIQKGMWNSEVVEKRSVPSAQKPLAENLTFDTVMLPLGQELGIFEDESTFYVTNGQGTVALSPGEYFLWRLVRRNVLRIGDLIEALEEQEDQFITNYIKPMIEKKLITPWSLKSAGTLDGLRPLPLGIGLSNDKGQVVLIASPIADKIKIEFPIFLIWSNSNVNGSLTELQRLFLEETNCTYEEAKEAIYEFIPYLMCHDLMTLVAGGE
ncbi:hypothetical protein [Bacillus sp. MRMR6]|uniref:hypothetical protein n=1 Tax=Bacillus sp. MRMR6 TaxID=1928617 RepID=UPI00095231E1|nr:hypothetical protein [Bacillus sp. MRMR6]OLS41140.1 hypothetical protein BTR25_04565 [Bacillus sp. MRMR6]